MAATALGLVRLVRPLGPSAADAASISLCADGRRLPVAMDGEYKALEAAYRQSGVKPAQAVLASVEGLIVQRPSPEEGQPA